MSEDSTARTTPEGSTPEGGTPEASGPGSADPATAEASGTAATTGASAESRLSVQEIDALGEEIAQLAGQIAAATARFLRLLGEFDAAGGWGGVGIRSLAHWLSWRAGMSLRTARDHVRVARALRDLPLTAAAFGRGELSFSKVRALTRVASRETEPELLAIATSAPAAHVERLVAGLRKMSRPDPDADGEPEGDPDDDLGPEDEPADEQPSGTELPQRPTRPVQAPVQRLQWRWDEDTEELVVWGRFGAADGKTLLAALTRAELERIRTVEHDEAPAPDATETAGAESPGRHEDEPWETVDRTAPPPLDAGPALVALAQMGLAVQDAPAHAPAAEVIFLHRDPADAPGCSAEHHPDGGGGPSVDDTGVVSADDGPALDPGTGEEVLCGAAARCVLRGADGAVLAYGRRRRLFSAAQLRALLLRDRGCRTPGCQRTRFLHAHHVVYWTRGGPTDLDNAILLCSACHRAVHLGRLLIRALGGQRFEFIDASTGAVMVDAPAMFGLADQILADRTIMPRTITGGWEGQPLDLSLTTATLVDQWRARAAWPPEGQAQPWRETTRPPWPWETAAAA